MMKHLLTFFMVLLAVSAQDDFSDSTFNCGIPQLLYPSGRFCLPSWGRSGCSCDSNIINCNDMQAGDPCFDGQGHCARSTLGIPVCVDDSGSNVYCRRSLECNNGESCVYLGPRSECDDLSGPTVAGICMNELE